MIEWKIDLVILITGQQETITLTYENGKYQMAGGELAITIFSGFDVNTLAATGFMSSDPRRVTAGLTYFKGKSNSIGRVIDFRVEPPIEPDFTVPELPPGAIT